MFNWLRRRRLSADTKRKLLIAVARSEEALIETHVDNVLELLRSVGNEIDLDRAITIYAEMMSLDEPLAATVSNRVLAHVGESAPRASVRRTRRFGNKRGKE